MAEYITKEQVIEWFRPYGHTDEGIPFSTLKADVTDMPAADVVPVIHGRWEAVKYNAHCSCGKSYGVYHFLCSACNHIAYSQPYGLGYCPNCGAKMDGDGI